MSHSQPSFSRIAIIGVGLLGASLGLALRKHNLARTIVGVGRKDSPSLDTAKRIGAIDEAFTEVAPAVSDADLVVLATPVRQFVKAMQQMAPALKPGAIVTDVGSTKQDVLGWAAEHLPKHAHFVGSHPMAGSEKRGPEAARVDLYQNAVCIVCGDGQSPEAARVEALWQALGMSVVRTDASTHDRWVARVSHLPHAVAFALMNAVSQDPAALAVSAGGLADTTRTAASDTQMWLDIFMTNRMAVVGAINDYLNHLSELRTAIAHGDEPRIRTLLETAKSSREQLKRR